MVHVANPAPLRPDLGVASPEPEVLQQTEYVPHPEFMPHISPPSWPVSEILLPSVLICCKLQHDLSESDSLW